MVEELQKTHQLDIKNRPIARCLTCIWALESLGFAIESPFYTAVAENSGFMPTNNHLTGQLKTKKMKWCWSTQSLSQLPYLRSKKKKKNCPNSRLLVARRLPPNHRPDWTTPPKPSPMPSAQIRFTVHPKSVPLPGLDHCSTGVGEAFHHTPCVHISISVSFRLYKKKKNCFL